MINVVFTENQKGKGFIKKTFTCDFTYSVMLQASKTSSFMTGHKINLGIGQFFE